MKALLISCLAIALFAAGYLTARFESGRSSTAGIDSPAKLPREKTSSSTAARHAPPQDFHLRFMDAEYEEREKMMKDIDAADLPAYIELLLAQTTPEGLDYSLRSAIDDMMARMMKEDPKATVDWILGQPLQGNRDFLMEKAIKNKDAAEWVGEHFDSLLGAFKSAERPHELLKSLISTRVDTDPLDALRLAKEHLRDEDGHFDFPGNLVNRCAEAGWSALFEYYKDSWSADNSSSGWSWGGNFPINFDFSSFASAWKAHEAGLKIPDAGGFYEYPGYVWKTWSERDPQAAYEFMKSGGSRTFDLDDFISGYSNTASPGEMLETLTTIQRDQNDPQANDSTVGTGLYNYLNNRGDALPTITGEIEAGNVDPSLLQSLVRSMMSTSSYEEKIGPAIFAAMPADQRLDTIRAAHTRQHQENNFYHLSDDQIDTLVPLLVPLGHSETEIRAALADE